MMGGSLVRLHARDVGDSECAALSANYQLTRDVFDRGESVVRTGTKATVT
jgi:hypothetical protein